MDSRQLEVFDAVMSSATFTEAAGRLRVTQPAISTAMAKLERDVGFALFRVEGRRVVPTMEAKLLHAEAVQVLAGLRRLSESAAGISAAQSGTLTIATNPGPGLAWLPTIAAEFCRTRPDVRLRLLTRSSDEVRDLAALSAFDLGLAEAPFSRVEIVLRRYSFARVVVLPAEHRLTAEPVLTPELLNGEAMVATVNSSWSWGTVARAFEAAGARCRVVAECEFSVMAINMVAAGMGVCIADPLTAVGTASRGLVTRPFRPILPYDVGLLRPARGPLTRLAEAFAAAFHAHVAPQQIEPCDV